MFGEFMWQRFCFTGNVADYLVYKEAESEEAGFIEDGAPGAACAGIAHREYKKGRLCGPYP